MDGILKELSGISVETLRQQLQSYGESVGPITGTTKYLFVKKLAKKKFDERFPNTSSPGNVDGTIVSTEQQGIVSPPSDADNSSAQGAQGFNADNSGDVTYYGISLPMDLVDSGVHKASPLVFTDKSTALKTLKAHKGSRFKTFKNRAEAECFSKSVVDQISSPLKPSVSDLGNVSSVEAIAFKSLKMPELVALRRLIEKGDCDAVRELVWSNPRYLISSGDTPVILQEGFRYNALHVAAKGNQARVCELILGVVQDPEFVRTLYPMDTELTCNSRVHFLTDLYLNMPDKGFCESPLHFACKFGYAEVVEVLASHPSTDRQLANKHGETPAQVVCSRCDSTAQAERIKSLLEDCCFVPLLRSEDNCTQAVIGEPWSPDTVQRSSLTTEGLSQSPCDPQLVVRAYAGPMSPSMAETFHKRWTTPPSGSPSHLRRRLSEIRREDCEKGEERIGRKLSQELNVAWAEYWQFLKAYIDLSSTKGLTLLNNYLRGQYVKLFPEDSSVDQERLLEKNLKNSELRENESPRILDCSGTEGVENVTGSDLKYPDGFMGADRPAEMDAKYRDRQRRDSQSSVSSSSSESNYSSCMSGSDSSDDEKFHNSVDTTMSGPHSFRQEGPGPPSPVIRDPLLHWDGLTSPCSPNNAELRGQANSDSHTNPWAPQPSVAPQRASPQSGGDYSCPQGLDASHPSVPGAFTTYRSARSSSTDLDNSLERSTSVETESDLVLPNYQSENSLDRPSNDSMDQMINSLTSEMQNKLLISWAMKDTESCGNLSFDALAASQNSGHVFDQHGVDRARSAASSSCVEGKSSQPCLAQSSLVQKRTDSPGVFIDTPNRPFLPPANHLTPIPHLSAGPTPHTTHTPERKPQRPTGAFIEGGEATKLDVDVLRALGDTPIDAQLYPYIARWKRLVTSYDQDTQHSWPTPARLRASRSGHGSPQLTSSPVSRLHPQSPLALPTQSFPQSPLASPAQTQRLHPPRFNLLEELKRSSDPT